MPDMTENQSDNQNQTEKPKINVVDRRHWANKDDEAEATDKKNLEERYPTFVEKLKKI